MSVVFHTHGNESIGFFLLVSSHKMEGQDGAQDAGIDLSGVVPPPRCAAGMKRDALVYEHYDPTKEEIELVVKS